MNTDIFRCPCNACGSETEHDTILIGSFSETKHVGEEVSIKSHAVICRGCKSRSIREEITRADATESQIIYKPPRLWFRAPQWVQQLEMIDAVTHDLLIEVYAAAHEGQFRLLAMGVRAALDHVMTEILGDIGGFKDKINEMVDQRYISEKQKNMLEIVIDAGSATAHRGYKPPRELLVQMMSVVESIIHQNYISGPMLERLKVQIPPRPLRRSPRVKNDSP